MNLQFQIDYQTVFGEELVLNVITSNRFGDKDTTQHRMETRDGKRWYCLLNNVIKNGPYLDYYYSLNVGEQVMRREWTLETHRLELETSLASNYTIYDHWIDIPDNAYLYSSAFTDCINRREHLKIHPHSYAQTIRFAHHSCVGTNVLPYLATTISWANGFHPMPSQWWSTIIMSGWWI